MFKKDKRTPEEKRKAQDEKINDIISRLNFRLNDLEKTEKFLVNKVVECKAKNLTAQAGQARAQLSKCLQTKKSLNSMIMTLELTLGERDIANINQDFLSILNDVSDEINVSAKNINTKKVENKLLKARYNANKKVKDMDKMLNNLDYATMMTNEQSQMQSEYDQEIDSLIEEKENEVKYTSRVGDRYSN